MRLSITKNIHKIFIYLGLLTLLFSLLLLSGRVNENNAGKSSPLKIQGEQTQNTNKTTSETTNDSGSGEDSNTNTQNSIFTSTKILVSVNSNTSNNGSTSSFSLNINGNENDFSTALDECLEKGEVEINEDGSEIECELDEDGLKIDFDIDNNQKSTSKTKIKTSVIFTNESND